ncbi:hypothetical protein JXA88_04790 [Candidatus Fermentibacteria bacterium]|nr:hypothetical protein [Candidatus Fermentibacteria bacterium]
MKTRIRVLLTLVVVMACAGVGRRFAVDRVADLTPGVTTQADVINMLGQPWRTGLDNGLVTWTYARYRWSLFSGSSATDLVARFDDRGVLVSSTFNTTETHTGVP